MIIVHDYEFPLEFFLYHWPSYVVIKFQFWQSLIWSSLNPCTIIKPILFIGSCVMKSSGFIAQIWSPFYWHGLTLIPAWISTHMLSKVQLKFFIHSQNFNVQFRDIDELFHPTLYNGFNYLSMLMDADALVLLYNGFNYLSMLRFKLIHVNKRGPGGITRCLTSVWWMLMPSCCFMMD